MRSAASTAATRQFFARRASATAVATYATRDFAYRGALALWDGANPTATYEQRDVKARVLRRKFKV